MTSIHTRIKQRREELGLSMQALADLVGVSAWQTVQQWEREDGTAPKRDRLDAVATALQTTSEYLVFGKKQRTQISQQKRDQISLSMEAAAAGVSNEAMQCAKAFDSLKTQAQQDAVIAQLRAFGAWK